MGQFLLSLKKAELSQVPFDLSSSGSSRSSPSVASSVSQQDSPPAPSTNGVTPNQEQPLDLSMGAAKRKKSHPTRKVVEDENRNLVEVKATNGVGSLNSDLNKNLTIRPTFPNLVKQTPNPPTDSTPSSAINVLSQKQPCLPPPPIPPVTSSTAASKDLSPSSGGGKSNLSEATAFLYNRALQNAKNASPSQSTITNNQVISAAASSTNKTLKQILSPTSSSNSTSNTRCGIRLLPGVMCIFSLSVPSLISILLIVRPLGKPYWLFLSSSLPIRHQSMELS